MSLLEYKKTIIASFLIIFACIGLARFAFGMVLPNIQDTLDISMTKIGFISSANFVGYFIGIFFTTPLYNRFESYKLIIYTLVIHGISMFCMVISSDYLIISFFYFLTGFFTAIVNLSLMAYIANIVPKHIRGKALGIVASGSGLAIITSGLIVPYIESFDFSMPWKYSWGIFSILVILTAFFAIPGLKKHTSHHVDEDKSSSKDIVFQKSFWKIGSVYIIFGITYIIYVTFFVSAVMDKYSLDSSISSHFWIIIGFMSMFSGYIFGLIADKFGAFTSLIIVYIFQTIAHAILAFDFSSYFIWMSAILYGITVWSIPSLVALLCSVYFDVKKTAQVLSLLTLFFAVAQAIAPLIAGVIKDMTNSFDLVFIFTSILCFVAIIFSYYFSKEKTG